MALNPNIILGLRSNKMEAPDPVEQYTKGLQLKGLMSQQTLSDQAVSDDRSNRDAFAASGGDSAKYLQALASGGNYKAYQAAQKAELDRQKATADISHVQAQTGQATASAGKSNVDAQLALMEHIASVLSTAKDPTTYAAARQTLGRIIPQALDKLPEQYDPMLVQSTIAGGMKRAEQLKAEHDAGTLAQTKVRDQNTNANAQEGHRIQIRGQDKVDDRARDANDNGKWQYDATRGVTVNAKTGEARPVMQGGQPIASKDAAKDGAKVTDAKDVLALLDQAEPLIDQATNSYTGVGYDEAARAFGLAPKGAQAAAQLRALEGALIAKMPKMSGPQSDKDVLLYKQMAGQIGDPTIPASQKKAAMSTIRTINERHAGMTGGASGAPRPPPPKPDKTNAGASVSNW